METGYSSLLSEYVKSSEVESIDCETFKIVCPVCKEPLTKLTDSFIHKNSPESKCSSKDIKIDDENAKIKESRTKYLCNLIEQTVYNTFYDNPEEAETTIQKIVNTEGLKKYLQLRYETCKKVLAADNEDKIINVFNSNITKLKTEKEKIFNTPFSIDQQKKLALEIWYYSITEEGKNLFVFLYSNCFYGYIKKILSISGQRDLTQSEIYLVNIMKRLIGSNVEKGNELFITLGKYKLDKPNKWSPENLFDKITIEITYDILFCLLELPYKEMLKEYQHN